MGKIYLKNFDLVRGQQRITRETILPAKCIDKPTSIFIQFQEIMDYGRVDNLLKINKNGQQGYLKRQGAFNLTFKFNVDQKDSSHLRHIYGTMKYDLQTLSQTLTYTDNKIIYQVIFNLWLAGEDKKQQGIYLEYTHNEGENNERY